MENAINAIQQTFHNHPVDDKNW